MKPLTRPAAFLSMLMLTIWLPLNAQGQEVKIWQAGRYTVSDELGGFRITGVSGQGTRSDPLVIRKVFDDAFEGTMVIRSLQMSKAKSSTGSITNGTIYMLLEVFNNSELSWTGFGLELQEILNRPSTYGDGLSFDQLARRGDDISSDRFQNYEDEFEPGDRLIYSKGSVDHRATVSMQFIITDFTPVAEFYLLLDPLVPAS